MVPASSQASPKRKARSQLSGLSNGSTPCQRPPSAAQPSRTHWPPWHKTELKLESIRVSWGALLVAVNAVRVELAPSQHERNEASRKRAPSWDESETVIGLTSHHAPYLEGAVGTGYLRSGPWSITRCLRTPRFCSASNIP